MLSITIITYSYKYVRAFFKLLKGQSVGWLASQWITITAQEFLHKSSSPILNSQSILIPWGENFAVVQEL